MTNIILKNSKLWISILLLTSILFSTSCSSDKVSWEDNDHREIWLRIVPMELVLKAQAETKNIYLDVAPSFDVNDITFEVADDGKEWCSVLREGNILKVSVLTNPKGDDAAERETTIYFTQGESRIEAKIIQKLGASVQVLKASHPITEGEWDMLFDELIEDKNFASMGKPGRHASVPAGDIAYLIIDMGEKLDLNYVEIHHRTDNKNAMLRVWGIELYGSNDEGDDKVFELIDNKITFRPDVEVNNENFTTGKVKFTPTTEAYRYVKFVYADWNTGAGGSMQMSELSLGYIE